MSTWLALALVASVGGRFAGLCAGLVGRWSGLTGLQPNLSVLKELLLPGRGVGLRVTSILPPTPPPPWLPPPLLPLPPSESPLLGAPDLLLKSSRKGLGRSSPSHSFKSCAVLRKLGYLPSKPSP